MKRLTFDGNFCDIAMCAEMQGGPFCANGACSQRETWERLKAIEDILGSEYDIDRLRELAQAEKDGLLVVLPCKVGDVLYAAESAPVIPLHVMEVAIYLALEGEDGGDYERISNIGKTVFLTRAEAEKALEARKDA